MRRSVNIKCNLFQYSECITYAWIRERKKLQLILETDYIRRGARVSTLVNITNEVIAKRM